MEKKRSNRSVNSAAGASALAVKQSIYLITLVTVLFFLWDLLTALLDVLNSKFQTTSEIIAGKSGGI